MSGLPYSPDATSFSAVRKLDRLPTDLGRRYDSLSQALGDRAILPVENVRVAARGYGRLTLASMKLVNLAVEAGYPLAEVADIVDKALPVTSRIAIPARVLRAELMHTMKAQGEDPTFRAVGILFESQEISTELRIVAASLRTRGGSVGNVNPGIVIADNFAPQSKSTLDGALEAINYALPPGTIIPLRPAEFLPYIPRSKS